MRRLIGVIGGNCPQPRQKRAKPPALGELAGRRLCLSSPIRAAPHTASAKLSNRCNSRPDEGSLQLGDAEGRSANRLQKEGLKVCYSTRQQKAPAAPMLTEALSLGTA